MQCCLRHLLYQLKHFLYLDGMAHQEKLSWVKRLIDILFRTFDVDEEERNYSQFMEELKLSRCMNVYNHLKNAEKELTI